MTTNQHRFRDHGSLLHEVKLMVLNASLILVSGASMT